MENGLYSPLNQEDGTAPQRSAAEYAALSRFFWSEQLDPEVIASLQDDLEMQIMTTLDSKQDATHNMALYSLLYGARCWNDEDHLQTINSLVKQISNPAHAKSSESEVRLAMAYAATRWFILSGDDPDRQPPWNTLSWFDNNIFALVKELKRQYPRDLNTGDYLAAAWDMIAASMLEDAAHDPRATVRPIQDWNLRRHDYQAPPKAA